jgi:ribose-phosphate pyrophosphokinase
MTIHLTGSLNGEPTSFAPTQGLYPDNTPWVKGTPDLDFHVEDIFIRQINLQDFVASLMYVDALSNWYGAIWANRPKPRLVIPFFPCARQDRNNFDGGDALNSKAFIMRMLEPYAPLFDGIWTFDMHSENWNRPFLRNIEPAAIFFGAIKQGIMINPTPGYYDTIIAPDKGAIDRAKNVAAIFHTPLVVADKVRDLSTGQITHYEIPRIDGASKVLVIDDICDGGATFELLAKALPVACERHLYVTHGLFSRGTKHLLEAYDEIITTNSVYRETGKPMITVIDLFPGVEF